MKPYYLLPFLLILFSACSSIRVSSDYDPKFDFAPLESFAIVYPQKTNTLTQSRIAKAITTQMLKKGYRETARDSADFIILFHTDVTNKTQVVTDYQMAGFYPYYGYGAPMAVPVQREYSYDEGKIIIDALDPKDKKIFWRGIAADRLKNFDTPDRRIEYINQVVAQTLQSFPKKR